MSGIQWDHNWKKKGKKTILTDNIGIVKEIQHPFVQISFDGQGLSLTDLRKSIIVRFSPTTGQKEQHYRLITQKHATLQTSKIACIFQDALLL